MKQHKSTPHERYEFAASPWTQNLTQQGLANLLGFTKTQLEALIRDKEKWVKREQKPTGKNKKIRDLAYPFGKLRRVHELIKFHLNKIKQPSYLYSPRKSRSQRDNAKHHIGQEQFLEIDICKFYPSTTSEHIFRWAHYTANMRADVAGMFTKLVVIDEKMPFGSPASPALMAQIHRKMFDDIFAACCWRGVKMSLWVDNLELSGKMVPGELLAEIRDIIRRNGLRSHDIKYRSGGRPVVITGVPIDSHSVLAPLTVRERIEIGFETYRGAQSDAARSKALEQLLSHLGTYRYFVGSASPQGRKASSTMNGLRRRRIQLSPIYITQPTTEEARLAIASGAGDGQIPF